MSKKSQTAPAPRPSPPPRPDGCWNCRWWRDPAFANGTCVRFPPAVVSHSPVTNVGPLGVFPATGANWVCGEHSASLTASLPPG